MNRNLAAVGIDAERFPAIDARHLDRYAGIRYVPHSGDRWEIPDSLIGCFESHRRLWQRVVDENLAMAAIFEDDVVVTRALPEVFRWLETGAPEFDVVKLDSAGRAVRLDAEIAGEGRFSLRPILAGTTSAGAYVISRRGAGRLLALSDPYSDHVDDFVFAARRDYLPLQLNPTVVAQVVHLPAVAVARIGVEDASISEGERGQDDRLNRRPDRGPPSFRLRKEIRRTRRKLYWKYFGDRALIRRGGIITNSALDPDSIVLP